MKKQVIVCDHCGGEVDGGGAVLRLNYDDARSTSKVADLCKSCADGIPGRAQTRRGRPRKVEA